MKGKTALVTGGAVRLGAAIARTLAARGCDLVIHYNRSAAAARRLAAGLRRGRGCRAFCVQGGLERGGEGCAEIMEKAFAAAGRVDFLVNNAAVFELGTIMGAGETKIKRIFDINFFAPLALIRAFAAKAAKGAVVNILDCRIAAPDPASAEYSLSKKALADLTLAAALELAPDFTVNAVAPGPVLAPPPGARAREKAGPLPLGRRPTPQEVAAGVAFLLESDSITGQILYVDGGRHLLGAAVGTHGGGVR